MDADLSQDAESRKMPALTYNQANSIVIKNDIVLNTYTQYI
jgi:hypothetical protein